jgi:hypothetical protein
MNITFCDLVPHITKLLIKYHDIFTGKVKAEQWEEIFALALKATGFGSNWVCDNNHRVGVDQTTDCGVRISNKSGSITKQNKISLSGSRLTKHKTLEEKLKFLSIKNEDYIVCLATDDSWNKGIKKYYFIVIASADLNYPDMVWGDTLSKDKKSVTGHKGIGKGFEAIIKKGTSDQLWTTVEHCLFKEMHEIVIPVEEK